MDVGSEFALLDKEVPLYRGFGGTKFDDMELETMIESEHQKVEDYIRDQFTLLSKDQLIENFIFENKRTWKEVKNQNGE